MSSFDDSFGQANDESRSAASTRPFDDDGYLGYDPRLPSQRFDSFTNFTDNESVKDSVDDSLPIFNNSSYSVDDAFSPQQIPDTPSPPPIYASNSGFSPFSPELNGKHLDEEFAQSDGPILPPPAEMQSDEGFALREWRRQNAIQLAEKEKREKELLIQIIDEANEYKVEFYRKRQLTVANNKSSNREKEKLFVANRDKFHAEADKNYWKAIAEFIPNEVPAIEKKRGKKDKDKKPSIVVIQGPKPGKPTDLSRMRQILVKLKHNTPPHMKPTPPPAAATTKDAKTGSASATATAAPPKAAAVATPPSEAIAAA
ncbi:Clathrin light chain [Macleaya cordata]|uniref:Clathrin light chain n=1 Tax=Macleaya cordata TaxID=56857 RepID=A0A200PWU6_MACCD|nr:Clathrin light chain [Macleaya cordata]